MDVLDLRKKEKVSEETLQSEMTMSVPSTPISHSTDADLSVVSAAALAERGLLTGKQMAATRLSYFFEREDGSVFSTSAVDAWNIRERRDRTMKYIGASNMAIYKRVMQDNASMMRVMRMRLEKNGDMLMKLENEALDRILDIDDEVLQAQAMADLDKKKKVLIAEQDKIHKALDEIEQKALEQELLVAKKNNVGIPNLSVVGDEGGVQKFGESALRQD